MGAAAAPEPAPSARAPGARRLLAPAKLNLYLELVGRRADGYHDLATLFATTDFGDDVEVERRAEPGVSCRTTGADLPLDGRNLAVRAALLWLEASGAAGGVSLALVKRVPVGGGLGGGSSDAAAVLRALGGGGPSGPEPTPRAVDPLALARSLGADVAFLLRGGVAEGFGRGDDLRPLPSAPPLEVVLVVPPFGTETSVVYARSAERLRPAPRGGLESAKAALASADPARVRDAHHNDLAQPAMRAYPALLRFTSLVERRLGRPPCLSGSGSALFDVPDAGEADDVVERLGPLPGRRIRTRLADLPPAPR